MESKKIWILPEVTEIEINAGAGEDSDGAALQPKPSGGTA